MTTHGPHKSVPARLAAGRPAAPGGDLPFHHPEHPRVFRDPTGPVSVKADVCVIGSGAGGATFAAELAEAGLEVVILEKGPYVTHVDMTQKERDMLPLLFEDAAGRTTRDGGFLVWHAHCVGGTTVVNNAICFDPPEHVLETWRTDHGVEGATKKDLAPALAKARFILDVQKIGDHEINRNAEVMRRGALRLGLPGDVFEHNRTACLQSGFCMTGCSYDRKQNHHITYIPRALSFGARLFPDTHVSRLERSGRRVTRAVGTVKDRKSGELRPIEVNAAVFVVAGGSISTPLLLLQSGLANSSGHVGRHLHCHPTAPVVAHMGDEEVRFYRGITQVYFVDRLSEGFLLESISSGPSLAGAMVPFWGPEIHVVMRDFNRFAAAFVQVKDENAGQVSVGPHGVPIVDYVLREPDATKLRKGYQTLARIYLAAGARHVQIPHVAGTTLRTEDDVAKLADLDVSAGKVGILTAHQMGTCRMGEDPRKSVVDSGGKAHDHDNLYVVDASVFPTSTGCNPQLTITTLATHFAHRVTRDRASVFGAT